MLALLCFLAALAAVLHWAIGMIRIRLSGMPPGPIGLPVVGNIWATVRGGNEYAIVTQWGKKYSGIYSSKLGAAKPSVYITSYKYFREVVFDHTWEIAGRIPKGWMQDETTDDYPGIIAAQTDEKARNVRRFTLTTLRNFGFGKGSMQESILRESADLNEQLRMLAGQPCDPRPLIAHTASNVISAITLGRTYKHGDERLRRVNEDITVAMKQIGQASVKATFPLLRLLPEKRLTVIEDHYRSAKTFFREVIANHNTTRINGEPRDFIDAWMEKQESGEASMGEYHTNVRLFAILLHRPDVQEKVHQEIDQNIGSGRQITLEDRPELPYTEAVTLEILRLFPLVPYSIPHTSMEDVTIGPYRIPKNTVIFLSIYDILRDPDLWTDPESFLPERFIHDGQVKLPEYYVPFGAGRRTCLGAHLAPKEVFLLFSNILRCFRVLQPPREPLPSLEKLHGAVIYPHPYNVIFDER